MSGWETTAAGCVLLLSACASAPVVTVDGTARPVAEPAAVEPGVGAQAAAAASPARPEAVAASEQSDVNFIVFDIDSLRADRLEGGPGVPANLRWLKQRGVLFTRAYPPAGWTLPSVVSMLAGRVAPAEALLPEEHPSHHRLLPGILAAYGYHTGVAWGNTLLNRHPRRLSWLSGDVDATDYGTAAGFARALQEERVPEPFFVLLHDEDLHTALMGRHLRELPPAKAADLSRQQYQQALLEYDRSVGDVLSAAWDAKLMERTIFVVLSDHGESLYEHDALGHGDLLWEEVARVPLLVVDPTVRGDRRETAAVSTLDLAPTLLERAGIPRHAEMEGQSLGSILRGERRGRSDGRAFVLDSDLESAAVVVDGDKLLVHPHGCPASERVAWKPLTGKQCIFLFNLDADPEERQNRASQDSATLERLTAALNTGLQVRQTPALDEYAEFLSELQQRGYWEAATPK